MGCCEKVWAWHGRATYVRAALLSETNKAAARRQTILKLCGYLSSAPSSACLLLPLAATTPLPPPRNSPSLPGTTAAVADKQSAPGEILKSTYQSYPKSEPKAAREWGICWGTGKFLEHDEVRGESKIAYEPGSLLASSQNIDRRWQPQRGVSAEPPLARA